MFRIDPTDVPPASNLPGPSVAWGRNRDAHILDLEKKVISLEQAQAGANRDRAASLANLSGQLNDVSALLDAQVGVDGLSLGYGGFDLTTGIWKVVASVSIAVPEWAGHAVATGVGMITLVANVVGARPWVRIGVALENSKDIHVPQTSPISGTSDYPFLATLARTDKIAVTGGSIISASLQVKVTDATQWYTGPANRKADISMSGVFTR